MLFIHLWVLLKQYIFLQLIIGEYYFCLLIFATYFILKYLLESPKWLYEQRKINESLEIIKKIAEINGKTKEVETFFHLNKNDLNIKKKNKIIVMKILIIINIILFLS